MNVTLEVVLVPVTDLDRAKEFYGERCGFRIDLDTEVSPGIRVIQATPPGSRCSIAMESGLPPMPGTKAMAPGTLHGLQLCVTDIEAARKELVDRGVDVSPVRRVGKTGWEDGKGETWNSFMSFQDPDGNGWVVQEAPAELSER
ncbi:VOC family protein [Streptomyces sp. NBC_01353]|uniref:VOC family protein n=1 Tax=Streptomyces sp. NBC_01353 TaxID=2903835 RepID=UPI002E3098BB|nr:VOC family protein [Streptomyces sp. NBC_01353]